MNDSLKCPQCGGNKFSVQGYNEYKCLYCGTSFNQAPPTPQANGNVQGVKSDSSNIVVNVNVPNNIPNNIGEPLNFSNTQGRNVSKGKSKTTAGILALIIGGLGAHHFYLGNTGRGILYLVLCWTYIPGIIAFIEGIMILCMNEENFDRKYNY